MKLTLKGRNLGVRITEFKDKQTGEFTPTSYVSIYQEGEKPIELKCLTEVVKNLKNMETYNFSIAVSEYEGKSYYKIVGLV